MSAPSADGWTQAAIERSTFLARLALQDECERLRAALRMRIAICEWHGPISQNCKADRERERADWEG